MVKIPRITALTLIKALKKAGFEEIRSKGSHRRLENSEGRKTTVPVHKGETIGVGLLAKILKDCDLTVDELEDLLGKKTK